MLLACHRANSVELGISVAWKFRWCERLEGRLQRRWMKRTIIAVLYKVEKLCEFFIAHYLRCIIAFSDAKQYRLHSLFELVECRRESYVEMLTYLHAEKSSL